MLSNVLTKEEAQMRRAADILGAGWSACGPSGDDDEGSDGALEWRGILDDPHYDPDGGGSIFGKLPILGWAATRTGSCSMVHWMLAFAVGVALLAALGFYEHCSDFTGPRIVAGVRRVWGAALQDLSDPVAACG